MKKKARSKKPVRKPKRKPKAAKKTKKINKAKRSSRSSKVTHRKKKMSRSTAGSKKRTSRTNKKSAKKTLKKPAAKILSVKTAVKSKKKIIQIPRPTPQENLERPFSIVESYMGTYDFKDIYSILFVCTGNMCRSPMAEGVLQSRVKAESGPWTDKILIQSCGTYAMEGNKPSQHSIMVARQHGIDISGIRSKSLNRVFIEQSDLILAMSIDHLNFILENYPTARQKTFLLKLFNKNRPITLSDSIPDPMGFSIEFYQKTFQEIRLAIDESYPHIMDLVNRKLNSTHGSL